MLLVPLITGAAVGLLDWWPRRWPLAPLTIAVLALFWLRTPVESWIGAGPVKARSLARICDWCGRPSLAWPAVSSLALVWLFWGGGIGGSYGSARGRRGFLGSRADGETLPAAVTGRPRR